jgi:ribosomal protein S18 acetylase RimI-like enzyme
VHPDEERLIQCLENTVAPAKLAPLYDLFEQMDRFHPEVPCWHLAFIAVDPARQGNGLGSALLQATLGQCDRDGRAAYLESTNPANMSLYRRFGFAEIGVIQADGMPPMFPMLRPAA